MPQVRVTRGRVIEWLILLGFLGIVLVFGFNFGLVNVSGRSMEPTFRDGQTLLFWRYGGAVEGYQPGDIVIVRDSDGDIIIKRIAFVQTEDNEMPDLFWTPTGYMDRTRLLSSNGTLQFPGYDENRAAVRAGRPLSRTIYLLGDNTWRSEDSRDFGPVAPSAILGKVVFPLAPETPGLVVSRSEPPGAARPWRAVAAAVPHTPSSSVGFAKSYFESARAFSFFDPRRLVLNTLAPVQPGGELGVNPSAHSKG